MGCENCIMSKIKNEPLERVTVENLNSCNKLNSFDWLNDIPDASYNENIIEVQFKNTRKEFYQNQHSLKLSKGDIVAVETKSGYDIGIVSLTGKLAFMQFKLKSKVIEISGLKKIYRKAKQNDILRWKEGKNNEETTMLKARKITNKHNLDLKIGDVEYQGDNTKATFYYIADGRVDYRELIKDFSNEFKVKIEMRQIGARQEAGRIGGIGSCGRELCCSTWKTDFDTVSGNAARYQNLSPSAQKYTGQCGKLKCCLMYELDNYMEAWQEFPDELLELETKKGIAYKYKIDILKKVIWYHYKTDIPSEPVPLDVNTVKQIIMMNKKGQKPDDLR